MTPRARPPLSAGRPLAAWAFVLLACGAGRADELKSGPQVGTTVPGQFEPLIINGPDAGEECCLFCRYGNARVVMIFARQPSAEVSALVRAVEAAAAKADRSGDVGACLVVTDPSREVRRQLGKLADEAGLKHVVLGVIDPGKVKAYELNPDAGVTVLLYSNKVVRANRAFKPGALNTRTIAEVGAGVRSHLGAK